MDFDCGASADMMLHMLINLQAIKDPVVLNEDAFLKMVETLTEKVIGNPQTFRSLECIVAILDERKALFHAVSIFFFQFSQPFTHLVGNVERCLSQQLEKMAQKIFQTVPNLKVGKYWKDSN